MAIKTVKIFILSVMSFVGYAQESDFGNWMLYFGNKQINEKFNWHNEIQYRNYNAIGDLEQLLVRTGIGYNLTKTNNNFLLGYGFVLSENYIGGLDNKVTVNEHRIYQQFITKQNIGILNVQHRCRFEQRFVEEDFKLRFRFFLSLNVPLNKKTIENGAVYISAYNEIFLNTEKNVFDRNRLYGGFGYRLNTALRFEVGYMNQFLNNGNRDQINIITFFNF